MIVQKMEQELSNLREAGRKIATLTAELERVKAERDNLKARYKWAANELLVCDYGDNQFDGEAVGWKVYGWRNAHNPKTIYGTSIDAAIDAARAEKGAG